MVGTSSTDAISYVTSVKKAFLSQPAKYEKFLMLVKDYKAQGMHNATVLVRMENLFKYHPELLRGFTIFLPPSMNIPPAATKTRAFSYILAVEKAFCAQPAKYDVFLKLLRDWRAHKSDVDSFIEKMEELMKDYQNLLHGFIFFLPKVQRAISPESEQRATNFLAKLKTSFQGNDRHVVKSFHEILKKFKKGQNTVKEVHEEITELFQGHDDLVMELKDFFSGRPIEIAKYITRLLQL